MSLPLSGVCTNICVGVSKTDQLSSVVSIILELGGIYEPSCQQPRSHQIR